MAHGSMSYGHYCSFPLLQRRPVKALFHATALRSMKLEVLSCLHHPGGVELCSVLIHKVGVLCPTWAPKVLHLKSNHDIIVLLVYPTLNDQKKLLCFLDLLVKCIWTKLLIQVHIKDMWKPYLHNLGQNWLIKVVIQCRRWEVLGVHFFFSLLLWNTKIKTYLSSFFSWC